MKYGYIRVSAKDQNPERQIYAVKSKGIKEKNIFVDYESGKNFKRPQYHQLLQNLNPKDLLVIKSIDRLGRNYKEILEQWRVLTKEMQIDVEVIDMPLLNTKSEIEGLTGTFIADMVLQILAYVAETERSFIKQRQAEGIAIAKEKGVKFGCKRIDIDMHNNVFNLWKSGQMSADEAASELKISKSTFYRRCRENNIVKL